jgi:hypothetical protein
VDMGDMNEGPSRVHDAMTTRSVLITLRMQTA